MKVCNDLRFRGSSRAVARVPMEPVAAVEATGLKIDEVRVSCRERENLVCACFKLP